MPIFSIATSICCISFNVTMMSYDKDVSPSLRVENALFYGLVPDTERGRFWCFASMFVLSTCHILLKVTGSALLLSISGIALVVFLVLDMFSFLLFKMIRRDLLYWVKFDSEVLTWTLAFLERIVMKSKRKENEPASTTR